MRVIRADRRSCLFKLLVVAAVAPFFDSNNPDRLSDWAMLEDDELREMKCAELIAMQQEQIRLLTQLMKEHVAESR